MSEFEILRQAIVDGDVESADRLTAQLIAIGTPARGDPRDGAASPACRSSASA